MNRYRTSRVRSAVIGDIFPSVSGGEAPSVTDRREGLRAAERAIGPAGVTVDGGGRDGELPASAPFILAVTVDGRSSVGG